MVVRRNYLPARIWRLRKTFWACFLAIVGWPAWAIPFQVTIEGPTSAIRTHRKQAELAMARNVDFCRGFTIPAQMGNWECQRVGGGQSQCKIQYDCRLIRRDFSRITQTRRLLRELENLPRSTVPLQISFSREPFKTPLLSVHKVAEARPVHPPLKEPLKELPRKSPPQELPEELPKEPPKELPQVPKLDAVQDSERELAALDEVFDEPEAPLEAGEEDWDEEDEEDDENEEDGEEGAQRTLSESGELGRTRKWMALEIAGVKVSDLEANETSAFGLAWTPWMSLGARWRLEGRLGGHTLKVIEETREEVTEEVFWTYHALGRIRYRLWRALHLWAGLGIQSWSSEEGGSFSMRTVGASWHFESPKFKFVDKLFVSRDWTDDDDEHTAIKVGLGLEF